ncbi:MAG: hypothetical protein EOP00_11975, partial [Pedobacter sp.]
MEHQLIQLTGNELSSGLITTFLNIPVTLGVGGLFDIEAREIKRAPVWMQKIGFEWLFRLVQEPKRMWKRYLIGNVKFIILFLKEFLLKTNQIKRQTKDQGTIKV